MIYPQNFEQKIGFDQIRQLLKDKCLSTLGEERVTDMTFSEQHEEVEEKLNQVTEFLIFHMLFRLTLKVMAAQRLETIQDMALAQRFMKILAFLTGVNQAEDQN